MSLQSVRGTHDLLPEAQAKQNLIIATARDVAARFGFREMSTPIFEFAEVFKRTLGEDSDVVAKEMYVFPDRNGEELVLRPEGTAALVRAFISEGLAQKIPFKAFYQGPMFRYERPQKGRQRQFTQIGVELLGAASPFADAECLHLAHQTLRALGVVDSTKLFINSLGDPDSRRAFAAALVAYLSDHRARLSEDSQRRLDKNPLRILDSKDPDDRALLANAPRLDEHYNDVSREFFRVTQECLTDLEVPFEVDPGIVRGLDYYTHGVFEFKTTALGAQDAVLSGGRYDGLVRQMGGPDTPGVGWAAGVERLALLSPHVPATTRPVTVIPVNAEAERAAFKVCADLRAAGLTAEIGFSGNLSKRLKKAAGANSHAAVMVSPDELGWGVVTVKWLDTGAQEQTPCSSLAGRLACGPDTPTIKN